MKQQNCPVCSVVLFPDKAVEPGLFGSECRTCHGVWIPAAHYWKWIELHRAPSNDAVGSTPGAAIDTGPAKRCPDCSHFLGHHKVGHALTFFLDHCNTCGGFWFDSGEWDLLKSKGMHTQVHQIFSPAWQAAVARDERALAHAQTLRLKLGDTDYSEGIRIREWIANHKHKAELYAMILPENA